MSSITAQQTKIDLKLVPKEKRLAIGKCNGRLNPGKKQREPTFQVVMDALALTLFYFAFLITANVPEVYMHQFWDSIHKVHGQNFDELPTDEDIVSFFKELSHAREIKAITDIVEDFIYHINNRGYKKQDKMYYPRFTKVIIHSFLTKDKTISKRNKIGMHTFRDDLINSLRFVSAKEESQIYRARLPKSMTSPEIETPVKSLSKKKEKMTFEKRKGINFLSEVALTEEAQYEEVRKKSLRDFHKTHPSGSGTFTKISRNAVQIKPSVTTEGSDVKLGVSDVTEEESTENFEHETDENESGSKSDQEENEEEIEDDEEE
uniref:Uncharacterized protein n=1 Tax=Tanacetum cinerariifolium TaxID=118510 RepID=A0A6L2M3C6_TANCI|nr:hypothetical protein [Tanacetum cinerariifolium]